MCCGWSMRKKVCDNVSRRSEDVALGSPGMEELIGPGQWLPVDALLDRLLLGEDVMLAAALASSQAAGLPPIEVSAQSARLLYLLTTICGARRVLEIGTLGGFSTICLARAVGVEGSVLTCEHNPDHAAVAARNLARAGLADRVDIRVGPALDTLAGLSGSFDLVFIDADKENNAAYVEHAVRLGHRGTVIVVDNAVRSGRILRPAEDDHQARGVREMLELVGSHPRLEAAAIQTVGAKGWDGFVIARIR